VAGLSLHDNTFRFFVVGTRDCRACYGVGRGFIPTAR